MQHAARASRAPACVLTQRHIVAGTNVMPFAWKMSGLLSHQTVAHATRSRRSGHAVGGFHAVRAERVCTAPIRSTNQHPRCVWYATSTHEAQAYIQLTRLMLQSDHAGIFNDDAECSSKFCN